VASLLIHLISNVPTFIISLICYILSTIKVVSSETSDKVINYWIDYQCHVLDLLTLNFALFLFVYPKAVDLFYQSLKEINYQTGIRLQTTHYVSLMPILKPKSPIKASIKSSFSNIKSMILNIFHYSPICCLGLSKELLPYFWPLLTTYLMDISIATMIHFLSYIPYIGGFIAPLITFQLIYPTAGPLTAIFASFVSIPRCVPSFVTPCAPRRMFSFFKTATAGDNYQSETSFVNILPIILYQTVFRLMGFYLSVYFNRIPFTKQQRNQWIKSRSGVLIGYIITVYIISSFLGPFGLLAIFYGLAGLGELIGNITTTPPIASSVETPTSDNDEHIHNNDTNNDDDNDKEKEREKDNNNDNNDNNDELQKSQSSTRLYEMQKLTDWIDKEIFASFSKKQYLKDFIEDFNSILE